MGKGSVSQYYAILLYKKINLTTSDRNQFSPIGPQCLGSATLFESDKCAQDFWKHDLYLWILLYTSVFKITSETCWTKPQFCQNLYMVKKESLLDWPKFCCGPALILKTDTYINSYRDHSMWAWLGSANERWCYNVTSPLIGWSHTQKALCRYCVVPY